MCATCIHSGSFYATSDRIEPVSESAMQVCAAGPGDRARRYSIHTATARHDKQRPAHP
ncbi:protein of unknown function [Pararobbsia alpina]